MTDVKTVPYYAIVHKKQQTKKYVRDIMDYYGVSNPCAYYIYKRLTADLNKSYECSIQLQNALIQLSKCNVEWSTIQFGEEEKLLNLHDIILDEQPGTPVVSDAYKSTRANDKPVDDSEWTVVSRSKKTCDVKSLKKIGLFI